MYGSYAIRWVMTYRYEKIAADLRRRILTNELRHGDQVPSTRDLAEQWSVARGTAARAVDQLRQELMVSTHPGRGGTRVGLHQPGSYPSMRQDVAERARIAGDITRLLLDEDFRSTYNHHVFIPLRPQDTVGYLLARLAESPQATTIVGTVDQLIVLNVTVGERFSPPAHTTPE